MHRDTMPLRHVLHAGPTLPQESAARNTRNWSAPRLSRMFSPPLAARVAPLMVSSTILAPFAATSAVSFYSGVLTHDTSPASLSSIRLTLCDFRP